MTLCATRMTLLVSQFNISAVQMTMCATRKTI